MPGCAARKSPRGPCLVVGQQPRRVHRRAQHQGQVVRAGELRPTVETGWRLGQRVVCTKAPGLDVHLRHRPRRAAVGERERHRRVVARHQKQRPEQRVDGVLAAGDQADRGSFRVRCRGRCGDHAVTGQMRDHHQSSQEFQHAGWLVATVRIARGQDAAGVEIGDHPRLRGQVRGQRGRAGRQDHAALAQRGAADDLAARTDTAKRRIRVRHVRRSTRARGVRPDCGGLDCGGFGRCIRGRAGPGIGAGARAGRRVRPGRDAGGSGGDQPDRSRHAHKGERAAASEHALQPKATGSLHTAAHADRMCRCRPS